MKPCWICRRDSKIGTCQICQEIASAISVGIDLSRWNPTDVQRVRDVLNRDQKTHCDSCRVQTKLLQTTRWGYLCNDCISEHVDAAYKDHKTKRIDTRNVKIVDWDDDWPDELPLDYRMDV